eukprot:gene6733-9464_t
MNKDEEDDDEDEDDEDDDVDDDDDEDLGDEDEDEDMWMKMLEMMILLAMALLRTVNEQSVGDIQEEGTSEEKTLAVVPPTHIYSELKEVYNLDTDAIARDLNSMLPVKQQVWLSELQRAEYNLDRQYRKLERKLGLVCSKPELPTDDIGTSHSSPDVEKGSISSHAQNK